VTGVALTIVDWRLAIDSVWQPIITDRRLLIMMKPKLCVKWWLCVGACMP
jgi:hypothetical protein